MKGQPNIDNSETSETLGTQDTAWRQTNKITTQSIKMMSNMDRYWG